MSNPTKTIDYAPAELALLDLLKKYRTLNTHQLADLHYQISGERPFNAEIVIGSTLRRLMEKMAINHEKFRIERTKAGRKAAQFRYVKNKAAA